MISCSNYRFKLDLESFAAHEQIQITKKSYTDNWYMCNRLVSNFEESLDDLALRVNEYCKSVALGKHVGANNIWLSNNLCGIYLTYRPIYIDQKGWVLVRRILINHDCKDAIEFGRCLVLRIKVLPQVTEVKLECVNKAYLEFPERCALLCEGTIQVELDF